MNALAHTTDLALINEKHTKNLRSLCDLVISDIFAAARRISKSGRAVTLGLHPDFISIYVHCGNAIEFTANPKLDDPAELIALLEKLEKTGTAPVPDVENDIYDLEEEACYDGEL